MSVAKVTKVMDVSGSEKGSSCEGVDRSISPLIHISTRKA